MFRCANGPLTGAALLAASHRLADRLPAGPIVNLCRDRSRFTALLLATILRGERSLLVSDRSPGRLRWLQEVHPGAILVTDEVAPIGGGRRWTLPALAFDPDPSLDIPIIPDDRLVAIVFTSGSTGVPVSHAKRWGELVQRSRAAAERFGLLGQSPATIVGTVPPQHMYGFETTILLPLHTPVASMSLDGFYAADVRAALQAAPAPRVLVTTPLQIRTLLESGAALPAPACVISATAPLDPALAAEAEARWGTRVEEIYGATEIGSIASRRTVAEAAWTLYPGVTLRGIAGGPIEAVAPPARPHVMSDVIEPVAPDPHEPGDVQRFRLLGRPGDLLKLGGRRASLAGLNAILATIPGVADGVFVAPDAAGEGSDAARRMQVFVVAPDRSAEDLMAELRCRIDPAFLPRRVVTLPRLPRNELGKITHEALGALASAGLQPACAGAV